MPLRDHFRPPLDDVTSWVGFFCGWPAVIVQHLHNVLPPRYVAGPRIYRGGSTKDDSDIFEVRAYRADQNRHQVAAIEIVSPDNKNSPENRKVFVAKCSALIQKGIAVTIVDLVTVRQFNLCAELLEFIGHSDQTLREQLPDIYAASCRSITNEKGARLETWSHTLVLGQPLPTLPLWLSQDLAVPLDLEQSYEQACHDLWIS
jgi:hypothetical protein